MSDLEGSTVSKTKPEVFIIESLTLSDEKEHRKEGELIARMLDLAGKSGTQYYYIRTEKELDEIVDIFDESNCRYLHISCHANSHQMSTTFDTIEFSRLGEMLSPCLEGRRVFVSGCSMASDALARELLPNTGCNSLIGPQRDINFDDAAAFWVSFYHLMFKLNAKSMKREAIRRRIVDLSKLYREPISFYVPSAKNKRGYGKLITRQ